MFNIILMILSMLICFSALIIVERIFKRDGMIVWVAVASVLANILVCKTINIAGFASALGNVMFASNFLATDILTEKYDAKDGKKAVILGLVAVIGFVLTTQIALLFTPDSSDTAQDSMKTLFNFSLRTSIASVTMYFVSNMLNIYIFEKLKEKIPGKLWFKSGFSTIISNCSENYLFAFGAFLGILDIPTILSIATLGTVIEIIVGIFQTPFIYLAKGEKKGGVE